MHGVFLDLDSLHPSDLDLSPLTALLPASGLYGASSREQALARVAEAEVIISNKVLIDAALMDAAPCLRLICVAATGVNNVDLGAARARDISVCNCRGYGNASVAQHSLLLMLALAGQLPFNAAAARDGRWRASPQFCLLDQPPRELAGQILGIIGYGELGQAVAALAQAFGMQVVVAERRGAPQIRPGRRPFAEVLAASDLLSIHCPLADDSRGLIGRAELAQMKRGALLINTARGGIVDEQALADALRSGQLGGAGVDVLSTEPPCADQPLLAPDLPNLILTPHIAWAGRLARQAIVCQLAENISAFAGGAALRLVQ